MTEPSPLTRLAEVPLGKGRAALPRGWFTRMRLADGQQAFERLVDDADLFKVVLEP